jgi:LPS export ABC transporter protein LptC
MHLAETMWKRWVRRGLLALSVIFASFLVYLLLTRTESGSFPNTANTESLERADAGIDQFTFMQSRAGAVQWEVRAQHARVFESENRALLDQVKVTLYGQKGRELRMEGDEGTIDTAKQDFVLTKRAGVIAVELESGYTIYTNHLTWTDDRREISTSDPVTISGHGLEVTGRGLIGKLGTEEFQILQDVHVEIVQQR